MHGYYIDEDKRTRVFIISGALSIIAARLFHLLVQQFNIPWWLDTPAVLGFFGIFVWLYNNHLWKLRPIQKLRPLYIPNLTGSWRVNIQSSYSEFAETIQATAVIRQTASNISIALKADRSTSQSYFAALICAEGLSTFELTFSYINRPTVDAVDTMSMHYGICWLGISEDVKRMDGEYYSGRGRQQFGKISLTRSER